MSDFVLWFAHALNISKYTSDEFSNILVIYFLFYESISTKKTLNYYVSICTTLISFFNLCSLQMIFLLKNCRSNSLPRPWEQSLISKVGMLGTDKFELSACVSVVAECRASRPPPSVSCWMLCCSCPPLRLSPESDNHLAGSMWSRDRN